MNEAQAIVEAYQQAVRDDVRCALATVVAVEGSAYRRPGARMLMRPDGVMVGSLSGGCLESDVFERVRRVIETGESIVIRYDTGAHDDLAWGLGLGCNGVVDILVEPLDDKRMPPHLKVLEDGNATSVIATVIEWQPVSTARRDKVKSNIRVGARALFAGEPSIDEIKHAELEDMVRRDARQAVSDDASDVKEYKLADGTARVFIEVLKPPRPAVIFGAGADVVPVVELLKSTGWHVTVVDTQARAASRVRFAKADAVRLCRPEDVEREVPLTARTMAVVMTHNYAHDFHLLKTLLKSPSSYIGCLGPKRRTEQLVAAAEDEGILIAEADVKRLYFPVGLDIGAETPEEIALSIVAEMHAVAAHHTGGFLKNRHAPIHRPQTTRQPSVAPATHTPQANEEITRANKD